MSVAVGSLLAWPKAFADGGRQPLKIAVATQDGQYRAVKPGADIRVSSVAKASHVMWLGVGQVISTREVAACTAGCPDLKAPKGADGLFVVPSGSDFALVEGSSVDLFVNDLDVEQNRAGDGATSTVVPD